MTREIIDTPEAPGWASYGSFPHSRAVKAAGLVVGAGQRPPDIRTGAMLGTTIQEQTRQALANIDAILRAAGSSMAKVVNATFILRGHADFAGRNEEWAGWFLTRDEGRAQRRWIPAQHVRRRSTLGRRCGSRSRTGPGGLPYVRGVKR